LGSKDEDADLNAEVSSRLDELFGDEESDSSSISEAPQAPASDASAADQAAIDYTPSTPDQPDQPDQPDHPEAPSPVDALKALVFSIDWEITDVTMKEFLKEVKRLKTKYADDRISLMFLKLHESLGKYIKARKVKAHPDALKLLTSIYQQFEKTFLSPELSDAEKKKMVSKEVKKYKRFQQQVLATEKASKTRGAVSGPAASEAGREPAQPSAAMSQESREMADYILDELKQTIKSEFKALRQLLKSGDA